MSWIESNEMDESVRFASRFTRILSFPLYRSLALHLVAHPVGWLIFIFVRMLAHPELV
jgi:hypothetical protein